MNDDGAIQKYIKDNKKYITNICVLKFKYNKKFLLNKQWCFVTIDESKEIYVMQIYFNKRRYWTIKVLRGCVLRL